jgi:peptide deformylase
VRYHAEELFAEAIEHELDHLDGKLYFDYIGSIDDLTPYTGREAENEEEGAALGSE